MITGRMSFTEQVKTDEKLIARLVTVHNNLEANGLPKTLEGLTELFDVYNKVYGQNKKLTNCIYCRVAVKDYINKAVLLLDIDTSTRVKAKPMEKPKPTASKKGPAKPKKRTPKK